MVGGYIPPVLHSFLYNFKVLKVKQKEKKKKIVSRFKLYRAQQFSDLSHTWTFLLVK